MTTLEIVSVSISIFSIATSWWAMSLLHKKDLLIDKLMLLMDSDIECKIEPSPYLIKRLEKLKDK